MTRQTVPKHDGFIRYVHKPFKFGKFPFPTPKKEIDLSRVYRVFTTRLDFSSSTPVQSADIAFDATAGEQAVQEFFAVRLFYVGAEADLDRYLTWLDNFGLVEDGATAPPIVVIEQLTASAIEEISNQAPENPEEVSRIVCIFPGHLTDWGLLTDEECLY